MTGIISKNQNWLRTWLFNFILAGYYEINWAWTFGRCGHGSDNYHELGFRHGYEVFRTSDSDMNTDKDRTRVSAHFCLSPNHKTLTYLLSGSSVMTRNYVIITKSTVNTGPSKQKLPAMNSIHHLDLFCRGRTKPRNYRLDAHVRLPWPWFRTWICLWTRSPEKSGWTWQQDSTGQSV